jgi:mannose-6-phosphate isomerase-like protein (cupin superfamily)
MYVATYESTQTERLEDTKRDYNWLYPRKLGANRDVSLLVERWEPGGWFRAHQHDFEQWFFVIEGQAQFVIDGEAHVAGPRTLLYCPRNAMHAGKNLGNGPVEVLVLDHWPNDSADRNGLE